jgi:hypothetical protein
MTRKIAFIVHGISPLMIKKDPFCIPYELARLGFDVLVIAPYDAIHVPGCRMARIRNIQISSKILPKYITDRLLAIVLFFDAIRTLRVLLDEGIKTGGCLWLSKGPQGADEQ